MTESLFETKFNSEPTTGASVPGFKSSSASSSAPGTAGSVTGATSDANGSDNAPASTESAESTDDNSDAANAANAAGNADVPSTQLPSLDDEANASALINHRVLVSAKEAGCLIGQNGQVIDSIREETNTKAGISKLLPGSYERILTVSGTLDDSAKALSYFAQALVSSNNESLSSSYSYFPLKQLSSIPNIDGQTTVLRLLIPNSQMGTLIGARGARIQQIQNTCNISMIASKSFLPASNERLVELQGTVDNLYDALRIISRCLIEDFSSIVGTNYYVPRGYGFNNSTRGGYGGPSRRGGASAHNQAVPNGNHHHPHHNHNHHNAGPTQPTTSASVSFANDIVGALIGKNGSRIQGVRKVSGATIAISDEVEGKSERIFTITGSATAVEKAKDLLYHNLEREEQRRAEANTAPAAST